MVRLIKKESDKFFLSVLVFLGICTVSYLRGCSPNHRYVKYRNITLHSRYPKITYSYIRIGTLGIPFGQNLDSYKKVVIRLSPDTKVSLGNLTVEEIEKASVKKDKLDENISVWPKNTVKIKTVSGFVFYINKSRILSIVHHIYSDEDPLLDIIGIENEKKLYPIPFNHQQMLIMFGKPISITDSYQH